MQKPISVAVPLASALLATATLVGCAEPPSTTPPQPSALAVAPSSVSVAEPPRAPAKLDAIQRLDLNRLAAELDLPLFWISDENGNGAVDPEEVATLWGIADA